MRINTSGRLSLSQRIGAAGSLIILTVFSLSYFITKGFSKDIAFATAEQHGIQYQRPLEDLLEDISTHQLLARRYLTGQKHLQEQMKAAERQVDAAMQTLQAVDSRLGETLQFTSEGLAKRNRQHYTWDTLHGEWESLKREFGGQTVENSDKLHAHLVADVRTMITHAGDTSNLILDPDLDSYYLMDATLLALPQTQDRLATIEILTQEVSRNGKIGDAQRIQLAVAAALLKEADLDRTMGDIQTSLNEDRNFYGTSEGLQQNLPLASQNYSKATGALLDLMRKTVDAPDVPVAEAQFAAMASVARTASFQLWQTGVQELDVLLQKRIDELGRARLWALMLTALALLISTTVGGLVIRSTVRSLRSASEQLLMQSQGLAAAAQQIASASRELASGASEQAASLEETSAATAAINSMARNNRESSRSAAELVTRSQRKFVEANSSLQEMVTSIGEMSTESDKISKFIKVIDEIAFLTNILALNAAVEAARAGQAGLGFAAVADEVRNLAKRCTKAANDTAALIEGSIVKTGDGKRKVDQVASAIRAITEESARIKSLVDNVDQSSQEQTRGVEDVAKAIIQMKQVTQENAANAERSASSAVDLNAQSAAVTELVAQIMVLAGGSRRG